MQVYTAGIAIGTGGQALLDRFWKEDAQYDANHIAGTEDAQPPRASLAFTVNGEGVEAPLTRYQFGSERYVVAEVDGSQIESNLAIPPTELTYYVAFRLFPGDSEWEVPSVILVLTAKEDGDVAPDCLAAHIINMFRYEPRPLGGAA